LKSAHFRSVERPLSVKADIRILSKSAHREISIWAAALPLKPAARLI
jgi:hypothetical protein